MDDCYTATLLLESMASFCLNFYMAKALGSSTFQKSLTCKVFQFKKDQLVKYTKFLISNFEISQMNLSAFCLATYMNTVFIIFLVLGFSNIATAAHHGNETDRLALLAFKSNITHDPFKILSSWNESAHFCQWHGVVCGRQHPQRVTMLDLAHQMLTGSISPYVGNLSFLSRLHLQNNTFTHVIPHELGRLHRLRYLWLHNNSIGGEIPSNISALSNLISFDVSRNNLVGKIPMELGFLSKLQVLFIRFNNLTGIVPSSLGNLSSLVYLNANSNGFIGNIPNVLGQLYKLERFSLGLNKLSGTMPPTIFNLSSLKKFHIGQNEIQGNLPQDLGNTLPKLDFFSIILNQFTGSIPVSVSNMSDVTYFEAMQNNLTGKVPGFGKSHKLRWLTLSDNHLGNLESNDLSFISPLTNCTNLQILALSNNNFGGLLPESFANLSTNLVGLWLWNNQMYGNLLHGISKFVNLTCIYTSGNRFTGNIPPDIGLLQNMVVLELYENRFSGTIPSTIGNLSQLTSLDLSDNNFHGSIPSSLGPLTNLVHLNFERNNLSGTIPLQVFDLPSLAHLYLAKNQITGSIPIQIGNLNTLQSLVVSDNFLSGGIPSTLGSCVGMEYLFMDGNFFQGTIPSSLITLRGMRALDLSLNNLSGQIPKYLEDFKFLEYLNLSFNNLEGPVPKDGAFENTSEVSLNGNPMLCGGLPEFQLPNCNFSKKRGLSFRFKLVISTISGVLGLGFVVGFLLLFFCWFRRTKQKPSPDLDGNSLLRVSYQSLLRATNGFSLANLIGVGSFGSVYKGILDHDGTIVAVKVLNLLRRGASKSFLAECEALRNIRHRNLVKVLSACSSVDYQGNDFKALVYEYMTNGSLEDWLHRDSSEELGNVEPKTLSFLQRLNIAIDVASTLDYLHNDWDMPIVHCDIKPSNVLLDDELVGHVGDFGLAKFLTIPSDQTSSSGVRGTIGYTAPECGMQSEVSTHGDVYSFGILLLEMVTGKRPTDEMFKDGFDLHNYAEAALPDRVDAIVDRTIVQGREEGEKSTRNTMQGSYIRDQKIQECLISALQVGVACSAKLARERMNITNAAAKLQSIRNVLLGT